MRPLHLSSILLLSFLLVACSKSEESVDANEDEHFASTQQRALEEVKGVENMLQETEEKRRKQAEEAN